jgi:hypothetical protein
MHFEVISGC